MSSKMGRRHPLRHFNLPNLTEIQIDSYRWFWQKGFKELLEEISPVKDWNKKELDLYFGHYYLGEPKYDESEAKTYNVSYEAPLRCRLKLVNKVTKETKEQEIFLGDFPLMTKRGTFIINGVERVVISQLIRSPGVFFTVQQIRGEPYFGAKIIPNRGAWLEFETDQEGVIGVRIDRRRRVPVTALLRVFAALEMERQNPRSAAYNQAKKVSQSLEEIKSLFAQVNNGPVDYIEATIKKDPTRTIDDSFIEVYKRIRPGDLVAPDNASSFLSAMFSFERYDLSKVGRWKIRDRLGLDNSQPIKNEERVLSLNDIIEIVKEIIRLNNTPGAQADDIDHLGNRRVRAVGELLQNRLRLGLMRMERVIRDRMSTLERDGLMPAQLVNIRYLTAAVNEFFSSSSLSQFMDQVNPLAELEHKRRLSAMGPGGLTRERAGYEARDVHSSHYGRICPIATPEGPNIGLVGHFALYARLNEYGFIETPYRRVKKGRVTNEIVYLTAWQEEKYIIAQAGSALDKKGRLLEKRIEARVKGQPAEVDRLKVDFIDVAPQQSISVATALIPFLEHDDSNRALMGSNMQRQAVACIKPSQPLVGTGLEAKAAEDSGQLVIAEEDGRVIGVDSRTIVVAVGDSQKKKTKEYPLHSFTRTNQYTCITQRPLVSKGQRIKRGDILADGAATDKGKLALGQNLLVAFMSWRGSNFEDAIILSERLVKDDRFTSVHIESFTCDVRETKLGPEITTPDIPNVSEEKLKNLDEEGVIRIGAEVGPNDILVGKISPKGETDLTAEERLLRAIFGDKARDVKDTSLLMPYGKRGRVVGIKFFARDKGDKLPAGVIKSIEVEVAQLRKVSVGDKLAGRHGNKGVIAKILPETDMPYLADGRPVDIILNPLGVATRMNIGQILETHLGWAAHVQGRPMITPALAGLSEEEIKEELAKAGLPQSGQVILYNGRSGEPFARPVTIGYIYMMKLNHLVEDKIHMRSIGPYSLITQQPLGGKAHFGGQRFGEMEVWALEGYGAAYSLQEMLTIKSDDVSGRTNTYDAIIRGKPIQAAHLPASFNVLVNELKALGLSVELIRKPVEEEGRLSKRKTGQKTD